MGLDFKILAWMDDVQAANPSIVTQYSAGRTINNRDLRVLVINSGNNPAKRVWIDCGIYKFKNLILPSLGNNNIKIKVFMLENGFHLLLA
jgi:hypothetical protein